MQYLFYQYNISLLSSFSFPSFIQSNIFASKITLFLLSPLTETDWLSPVTLGCFPTALIANGRVVDACSGGDIGRDKSISIRIALLGGGAGCGLGNLSSS
jgi:hypothetical protein